MGYMGGRKPTVQNYFTIDRCSGIIILGVVPIRDVQPSPFSATAGTVDLGVSAVAAGKEGGVDIDYGFAVAKHTHVHIFMCPVCHQHII